jgi:phosphoglycolate phosphatase
MVKLVLFDIDGTLIRTGGAGVKAFEQTFAEVFGIPEATHTLNFSGRTDVSLVRECFVLHGIEADETNFRRFFDAYPAYLERLLYTLPGGICEGIVPFMENLFSTPQRPVVGLLTGNIRRGAELKLRRYELWDKFELGAFADDHEDRNCIAGLAMSRGEQLLQQKLSGREILVIGDTPLDVACAKSIGAKVIAVATGTFTMAQLKESNPTWTVENLSQLTVLEALGRNGRS